MTSLTVTINNFKCAFLSFSSSLLSWSSQSFKQVCDSQNKHSFPDTWVHIMRLVHPDIANVWQMLEFTSLWCLNISPLSWQMVPFGFLFRLKFPTCLTFQKNLKLFNFQIIPFYEVKHVPCLKFPALYSTFVTFP